MKLWKENFLVKILPLNWQFEFLVVRDFVRKAIDCICILQLQLEACMLPWVNKPYYEECLVSRNSECVFIGFIKGKQATDKNENKY